MSLEDFHEGYEEARDLILDGKSLDYLRYQANYPGFSEDFRNGFLEALALWQEYVKNNNSNLQLHQLMTTREVAAFLGIDSEETVVNWLEGGSFPGAYKDFQGNWLFPRMEVLAMREHCNELKAQNEAGDLSLPNMDSMPLNSDPNLGKFVPVSDSQEECSSKHECVSRPYFFFVPLSCVFCDQENNIPCIDHKNR